MASIALALSWLKKNTVTVLLVILTILVLILILVGFWLRIKSFKVTDLLKKLQIANARNESASLYAKKKVLEAKSETKKEEIEAIDKLIRKEEEKVIKASMEIEGLSNAEVAKRLTDLGF